MTLDYEVYKEGGILNDRYQKVEDISEGSYGYVSLAKDVNEKKLVAVKYIFKLDSDSSSNPNSNGGSHHDVSERSNDSSIEKIKNFKDHKKSLISSKVKSRLTNDICLEAMYEVDIQTKIGKHKNIVQLLNFFDSYIIMEYCSGGDLYEAIKDDIVPRNTKTVTHMIMQIMDAIEFVHNKSIYHRDIKPENILITGIDWTIKLTDWGLATTDAKSFDRNVGSERYMAPELFDSNLDIEERKEPYECDKVDLWAMGIVFLNIVFHKNPFSIADQTDKSFCYFAANREALFDIFSSMTYDFFQVLRYCLTIDPTNRNLTQMRAELLNLNEYTFDDEYYNSLEENGYDTEISETMTNTPPTAIVPPSSAPVSLPTPMASKTKPSAGAVEYAIKGNTEHTKPNEAFKKPVEIPQFNIIQEKLHGEKNINSHGANNPGSLNNSTTNNINNANNNYNDNYGNNHYNNSGSTNHSSYHNNYHKSPKNSYYLKANNNYHNSNTNTNYNYSNYNSNRHSYNEGINSRERAKSAPKTKYNKRYRHKNDYNHSKAIKIENRNRSKIIKHSRKPLGIPTPNTHINNFFHDYNKSKEDHFFQTRDFFTPPSVNNRYMEGVFENNKYQKQHKNYFNNNNRNKNMKYNKYRRPSTTGNSYHNNKTYISRNSFNGNTTSGILRRDSNSISSYHNPGSYIPPNLRNNIYSGSVNIPDITTVLDESDQSSSKNNANLHHDNFSTNVAIGNEEDHDSDDILFSLEENDHDFVNDMNNLTIDDQNANNKHSNNSSINNTTSDSMNKQHYLRNPMQITTQHLHSHDNELPDLLKSPVTQDTQLNLSQSTNFRNPFNLNQDIGNPVKDSNTNIGTDNDLKHKQGVYILPHRRKSLIHTNNEAVLSVSNNSVNYSGSYSDSKPYSPSLSDSRSPPNNVFHKPTININHATTTTALQDQDVFANNDALVFEDDDEEDDPKHFDNGRTTFGPYEIYDNASDSDKINKFRAGRKSSTLQEEVVGSLEQYKNNWLMLQQQQD